MGDILPNQTIYVHNLPEKVKKDGKLPIASGALLLHAVRHLSADASAVLRRLEEVLVYDLFPVRQNFGYRGFENIPTERPGMGGVCGDCWSHKRSQVYAGIPLLRQTDGGCAAVNK